MKVILNEQIEYIAKKTSKPLYVVGGYVRNALLGDFTSKDLDLAGPITVDEMIEVLKSASITPKAEYKRTKTVVFECGDFNCEFTSFRKESYLVGGCHKPTETEITFDINEDALRRDFKCNAVYYDISNKKIVDPLGGVVDIKNKILDTVKDAKEVFSHDGLRLMRLARFTGELGFDPTENVLNQALAFSKNILDISAERIKDELDKILVADTKYSFSPKDGHYNALKVLDRVGVLKIILPEIALGKGLKQRSDFHSHDVLEHTFRAVRYAKPSIRLPALLHDVGKPKNYIQTGKYYGHDRSGEELTKQILSRLKYDNATIKKTAFLVRYHMYDIDCKTKENKVKLFIVSNLEFIEDLLLLKQADYSACKDDFSTCATLLRWQEIIAQMKEQKVPFSLRELKLTGEDLLALGFKGAEIGKTLNFLLKTVVCEPKLNEKDILLKLAGNKDRAKH